MTDHDGFSRRHFLGLLAGAAAAAGLAAGCTDDDGPQQAGSPATSSSPAPASSAPPDPPAADLPGDPFTLGVTSGDPATDSVVLWTRLRPAAGLPAGDVEVQWEVTTPADAGFAAVVAVGRETATAADNFSVHAIAGGLAPGATYQYRFRVGSFTSPVGTTATLPGAGAAVDELRFAFLSCQNYQDGFYTAYPHLVADQPELIVFLGDFIYEEGPNPAAVRQHTGGPGPLTTLDDYRNRYSLYLGDTGLKAARAVAPWIVIWDDHEVANDYANDMAASGSGPDFLARRANAYKAWWENQPVRMAAPTGPDLDINRSFAYGSLLSMVCLDGRQFRSAQVCEGTPGAFASLVHPCPDLEVIDREMLGPAQVAWAQQQLTASGARWNVIANQTIMTDLQAATPLGTYVQVDQWDGYPAARTRFLDAVKASGATNPVVITGDIHASVVGTVFDGAEPVATEFVGPSVSSSFPQTFNVNGNVVDLQGAFAGLPAQKPNVVFTDAGHHGYVVVTVTPDKMTSQYRVVSSVAQSSGDVSTLATFEVSPGKVGPVRKA